MSIQLGATATKANEVRKALETQRDQQLRANQQVTPDTADAIRAQSDELEGVLTDAAIAGAEAIARKLKDYGSFQVTATAGKDPADPNGLAAVSVSINAIP